MRRAVAFTTCLAATILAAAVAGRQGVHSAGHVASLPSRTLAYHLATNAVGRARGHTGGAMDTCELSRWGYAVYSITNLARLTNAVWSTNCWLYGVKGLSATAIGSSNGLGGQGLITLVSPRHYLFATHMHPEGFLTAFLGTNNVIYWRHTLERVDLTNDISLGILNEDLPQAVEFLPVAPADFRNYLPRGESSVVQGIGMNQDMRLFGQPMNFGMPSFVRWSSAFSPPDGLGLEWNVTIRGGDSSDPELLLIGDQLVLVSHNYTVNGGPSYAEQIKLINEKMRFLSRRYRDPYMYQLTVFPLKSWPANP